MQNCKDYDLCQYCEENLFEKKHHTLDHTFLKIETPLPDKKIPMLFPNLYTGKMDNDTKNMKTDEYTDLIHENIICSKCEHPIIGTRFFCTTCSKFNLCETCEVTKIHPETHCFLKIRFALPSERLWPNISLNLYGNQESTSDRNILTTSGSLIRKPKTVEHSEKSTPTVTHSEKSSSVKVIIREMMPKDLDIVYIIEKESFHTPYHIDFFSQFPYSENCFLLVAEKPDHSIGGYIAYKIQKNKLQVVSIAVANHSRRMGIAQQLMEQMMCFAHDMTVNEVYLHVSVMNFPAQNLYKSFGFTVSKWIKNYYSDENEHALFMVNKDIPSYVKKKYSLQIPHYTT